jgi:hypothetical protein
MGDRPDLDVLSEITAILDRLGIPYSIGGSVASSSYGRVRFTQDADITIQVSQAQVEQFAEAVKDRFYLSKEAMAQAIQQGTCFNVVHFDSAFKVDLFICKNKPFERQVLGRARREPIFGVEGRTFSFVSPEDIILLKLRWYRDGGGTSDRQWEDVLGVLGVQGDGLDQAYLGKWAEALGVRDLLDKAMDDVQ